MALRPVAAVLLLLLMMMMMFDWQPHAIAVGLGGLRCHREHCAQVSMSWCSMLLQLAGRQTSRDHCQEMRPRGHADAYCQHCCCC